MRGSFLSWVGLSNNAFISYQQLMSSAYLSMNVSLLSSCPIINFILPSPQSSSTNSSLTHHNQPSVTPLLNNSTKSSFNSRPIVISTATRTSVDSLVSVLSTCVSLFQ